MENESYERVMRALNFQKPDQVPHYDDYLNKFIDKWKMEKRLGKEANIDDYYDIDIWISAVADEGWPSKAGVLKREGKYAIYRDGWGMIQRQPSDAYGELRHGYFGQELEVVCKEKIDPDKLKFESPQIDSRYKWTSRYIKKHKDRYAFFCKIGGPYSRTNKLRGTPQFFMDIAEDPEYVRILTEKVTDHLIKVGLEQLKRDNFRSEGVGVWIFDDIAGNDGLLISPHSYEKIFYPSLVKMVRAFKEAGAKKVIMHSDGNIEMVLDMFIEAKIDAINPVEPKAGMDIVKLRKKYDKKLSFIGGICNARVLPKGSKEEIAEQVRSVIEIGRDGGVILAAHSIGFDIPVENYDWALEVYRKYR